MPGIKKSNTSKIFEKNNFGKVSSILSNENIIEMLINSKNQSSDKKNINDFLNRKRILLGNTNTSSAKITLERVSELLQSTIVYAKFTNELIREMDDIEDLSNSFKIIYISHDDYKKIKGVNEDAVVPDFLSEISVNQMLDNDVFSKINDINYVQPLNSDFSFPYIRNRFNPGLSAIQMFNPELRTCFKNSQELDLFFNMLSTLDITMSMPYVNAEFIIPKSASRNINNDTTSNHMNYLTTSLNNFLLGDKVFQKTDASTNASVYDKMNNARAINGDFYSNDYSFIRNAKNSDGLMSQIKKTYHTQSLNNDIFFSPQTMVNADYDISDNPNALVDKFRPFMSITNLTFDVRATKGLLNYKTATMELILYDKARMPQIAPFIKPELLNAVSSEIILEYGWQNNLGDESMNNVKSVSLSNGETIKYTDNPIAEFINSLKVKEKYIIVNSSYTINESGHVNISLTLAMKGAAELRGVAFQHETSFAKLQTDLNNVLKIIKEKMDQINTQTNQNSVTPTDTVKTATSTNTTDFLNVNENINNLSIRNINVAELDRIINYVNILRLSTDLSSDSEASKELSSKFNSLNESIENAKKSVALYEKETEKYFMSNFSFFNEHDARKNDAFVDYDWWDKYLVENWDGKKWISLGKLLLSVIGKRLAIEENRYNEVQFIFYPLNSKAIRASFLNIGAIPVDKEFFINKLKAFVTNASKISNEGMIEFILRLAVNEKAAAVYGLNEYLTFNESNLTVYKTDDKEKANTSIIDKKKAAYEKAKAINSIIFEQYYGTKMPDLSDVTNIDDNYFKDNPELYELDNIYGGLFDLTFNRPNVCINFDSTFHENDSNCSILKLHFYDKNDNPFESITEVIDNFHTNNYKDAISPLTKLRSTMGQINSSLKSKLDKATSTQKVSQESANALQKSVNNIVQRDVTAVIQQLVKDRLVVLKDKDDNIIELTENFDLKNVSRISINVNNKNKLENFANMKNYFKSYMPSLTLGQSRSALLNGSVSTNQDNKYTTSQILKANGEIDTNQNDGLPFDFEIFNQSNNSPTWVLPAQATVDIIGCPIVNFAQLIFIDFNTGTSIDNMYFISGLKHSISPGRFTTSLTLTQRDMYSKFTAESSAIQSFFKAANNFKQLSIATNNLQVTQNNQDKSKGARYQISFVVNCNKR